MIFRRTVRRLGEVAGKLAWLILPRCQVCAAPLGPRGREAPLCPACAARLPARLGGYCPGCGCLSADPLTPPTLCAACRTEARPWDGFGFYGAYEGLLRQMILSFKFGRDLAHGRVLGQLLVSALARTETFHPDGPDLVAPVPLHPRRLCWRGFNQSLELARAVSARLGRPIAARALRRIRPTVPQSSLPGRERLANIQGAFAGDPAHVRGRSILLIDDVMTTGATIDTAARALRAAGAARIEALVLAR